MKKTLLSLIVLVLFAGMATAQDPGKAYKSATRALGAYNISPTENEGKLAEAIESIEVAITGEEQKADAKVWNSRGEIYNAAASKDVNMLYLDQSHKLDPKTKDYAMMALESFRKGKELAEKKFQTKDALTGIGEAGSHLNAVGNSFLQTQAYSEAFPVLETVMEVHNELQAEKEDGIFADESTANNHLFVTAFCANIAGDKVKAENYFKKLYDMGYEEPAVYSNYFALVSTDEAREKEALAILEKGKEKFPGNTDLLFAEINYFLKMEKLNELIGKLETAIEKEPENVSLYTTLGNVYDNLYSRETEAGNDERANEYFDKALKYYKAAVDKAPDMADAIYSIGALYFNKAVVYNKSIQKLEGEGFSKENLAKIEDMEAKRDKLFDEALPHFKKAEKMNPNDQNTLIALKEIFARKDQLDLSKEFKTRLENVQNGGTNEPYFNK